MGHVRCLVFEVASQQGTSGVRLKTVCVDEHSVHPVQVALMDALTHGPFVVVGLEAFHAHAQLFAQRHQPCYTHPRRSTK